MEAARTRAPLAVDGAPAPSRYLLKLASDEKLVGRVRDGSEQAFAVLFERHHRGILSFCRHMLGAREEAEDVVQQSFANAYRALLGNDREINLKPWLYRIARNQCISVLRARRHDVELVEDQPSLVGLSDQVAQRDQLRHLLRDLAGLPIDQREALVLTELHDNSHVEVAAILDCEREKVKSLVFQARSSLVTSREAREMPCEEIRRQLSVLRGGALRRNTIRRHIQHCEGCRAFRHEVKQQRQALSVLLPVLPSAALKLGAANAMAAAGVKVASTAIGGGAAGPLAALAGKLGVSTLAVKGAAATVAVTVAAGGGAVAVKEAREPVRDQRPAPIERPDRAAQTPLGGAQGPGGAALGGPGGAAAVVPGVLSEEADDRAAGHKERRRLRRNRRLRNQSTSGVRDRKAEQPKAANERKLERRQRREQAERPKKVRKKKPARRKPAARKPARRRTLPPVATTPVDPAPTDPPAAERGPTFPSR